MMSNWPNEAKYVEENFLEILDAYADSIRTASRLVFGRFVFRVGWILKRVIK